MPTRLGLPPSPASPLPFAFVFHLDRHCPLSALPDTHISQSEGQNLMFADANFAFANISLQEIQQSAQGAGWELLAAFAISWRITAIAELDLSHCST